MRRREGELHSQGAERFALAQVRSRFVPASATIILPSRIQAMSIG